MRHIPSSRYSTAASASGWQHCCLRFCFAHDEGMAVKRDGARVAGGKGKASAAHVHKRLPDDLWGVLARLLAALGEVYTGTLDPRQATAMSSLAGSIARLY